MKYIKTYEVAYLIGFKNIKESKIDETMCDPIGPPKWKIITNNSSN